jgi:hypothetical protein
LARSVGQGVDEGLAGLVVGHDVEEAIQTGVRRIDKFDDGVKGSFRRLDQVEALRHKSGRHVKVLERAVERMDGRLVMFFLRKPDRFVPSALFAKPKPQKQGRSKVRKHDQKQNPRHRRLRAAALLHQNKGHEQRQ